MHAESLSHFWFSVTPRTAAHQAPLSMGFSRQEHWSGCPCPPPGDLPDPGIEPASPGSPAWAGRFFTTSAPWEAQERTYGMINVRFRAAKGQRGVTGEGDTHRLRSLVAFHFWSRIVQSAHCDVFKTFSVCTEFIIAILEKIPTFTHNYRNANVTEGLISQKKKDWCGSTSLLRHFFFWMKRINTLALHKASDTQNLNLQRPSIQEKRTINSGHEGNYSNPGCLPSPRWVQSIDLHKFFRKHMSVM